MVEKKYFYEKNKDLIDSELNKPFEEILWMTKDEFRQWVIDLRKLVVHLWDEKGLPPRVGYTEEQIIDQFNEMIGFPVHEFLTTDELTGEKDVIRNTSNLGNAANQWFPTMMKCRINYSKNDDGKSIYDFFAKDELLDTFVTYASRHFKRDSFYHYSSPVKANDIENHMKWPCTADAKDFIRRFEKTTRTYGTHDYWLAPIKADKAYTGYNEELKKRKNLTLTRADIEELWYVMPYGSRTNVDYARSELYEIRVYAYKQKVFPVGLKAFRVSFCQYAVNFPPLTARYLYERFTNHIRDHELIRIYDPSAGWGGRILGAMSVTDERTIHYIGTDPNTDHTTDNGRTKYHELADFFNDRTYRSHNLFPKQHTYEIYQLGSEVIRDNEQFQKHKGKVDLVFTSPPYFAKEAYSEDPEQSYKKFGKYDAWREGFLRPTLTTAVEWLANDRYLLWNIADAVFGGDMLPLEADSFKILEELGMKFVMKLKMSLAQMPGGNRIDTETGLPKAKNFCKVNGIWLKYEPVFIFHKPA
jgi:hypothetical protein